MGSAALGDDAQAVVFEVPEAIRAALDQFHLPVEAFGDAVVAGGAPHAGDRLDPVGQGGRQRLQRPGLVGSQRFDPQEQLPGVLPAFRFGLVSVVHEGPQLVHTVAGNTPTFGLRLPSLSHHNKTSGSAFGDHFRRPLPDANHE